MFDFYFMHDSYFGMIILLFVLRNK